MVYPLRQNPVPLWAVTDDRPIVLDVPRLPPYFESVNNSSQGSSIVEQPVPLYLSQSGKRNSNSNINPEAELNLINGVNKSILDEYDLHGPWENTVENEHKEIFNQTTSEHLKRQIIKNLSTNPFFPIFFRGSASMFSIISLGLSCSILVQTNKARHRQYLSTNIKPPGPASTTIFSIVVNSISVVYLMFSLYDETFGRPLGLRPPQNKIQFVFLDLLMLSLNSSNLSLAFDTMISRSYFCQGVYAGRVCSLQKAMTAFVFMVLFIWVLTFLISTFRMIDRATH